MKPPSVSLNAEGIVIGRQRYGDTSLIIRWLTPSAGRMTTMVKGALREKSPFRNQLDLYYHCDFSYAPSRRGEMHTLREMVLREPFLGLRKSWVTLLTLDYFSGLIASVTESDTALPEDYDLFFKAVVYLNEKASSMPLVHRFEQKVMQIHGFSTGSKEDFVRSMQHHHFRIPAVKERLYGELSEKI